jgi:hypothetical protein
MIHSTIEFDLHPPERLSGQAQTRRQVEIEAAISPLAERNVGGSWELDLDSPNLPELVRVIERLRKTKTAWMSFAGIEERLVDDAKARAAWFVLEPKEQAHLDQCFLRNLLEDHVYPFGIATRAKPGVHAAVWGMDLLVVSERFKAAVERHGLTGIDFLWVRDTGRYQALQWYLALPRESLGRGLDHPWYDPAKSRGEGYEASDPRARHGQRIPASLGGFVLRSDASFGDPVKDRLLALVITMTKQRMLVVSYPRYLRSYLPDTDFAFTLRDRQYGDEIERDRGLALSRRARELLVADRVITEDECTAVMVFARAPTGVENLDARYGEPPPLLAPDELAGLRAQEAAFWADHVAHPKPPRAPDLARSLSALRAAKRRAPSCFTKPATPKAIAAAEAALGVTIPAAWQKAWRVSNGCKIADSPLACEQACLILPTEKLAKAQREEVDYYREIGAARPNGLILVAQTEIGDSIWLDPGRKTGAGDCRVVLMSHETRDVDREWPSVAEFLEELLGSASP